MLHIRVQLHAYSQSAKPFNCSIDLHCTCTFHFFAPIYTCTWKNQGTVVVIVSWLDLQLHFLYYLCLSPIGTIEVVIVW